MLGGNNGQAASNRHACSACKHQRRRCESNCIMAQFFPANKAEEFQATLKTFGIGNMTKMLRDIVSEENRVKAVESFIWEGLAWKQDPIHGPLGLYRKLEEENELLKNQVNQQQIMPYVTELGFIEFKQCNINKGNGVTVASNGVTVASNKEDGINYSYITYSKEGIELDSQVNSYTNLLQEEEEAKGKGVDCIATPYYAISQGQQESVSQGRDVLIGQPGTKNHIKVGFNSPIEQGVSFPPMIQGQQRVIQGRDQPNLYNNGVVHDRGTTRALHGTGQAMVQPNFGQAQQRIMSQGGGSNAASYSNHVPVQTRVDQRRDAPYHVQRDERGQGINDLSFQQRTMNTNQNYTTQGQFDQVTYEDNDGFNFGQK